MENEKEDVRYADFRENAIEWYNGQDTITITLSQKKYINKIKQLANKYPNEVKIIAENENGSICAHIPLRYLKIQRPRELTEEERIEAAKRLEKYRKK